MELVAVVFHQDERLLPRRMVRRADKQQGGFVPFCFYGVWWNDYLRGCVAMGDDAVDTFRAYSGHLSEAAARDAAKEWLRDTTTDAARDVAFSELEPFARSMVFYVLRRGPSYFGGG